MKQLNVCISNSEYAFEEGKEKWISLPTTYDNIQRVFRELKIHDNNYLIKDINCSVNNLFNLIDPTRTNLDELNYLAFRLIELDKTDRLDKYKACVEMNYIATIPEAINLSLNMDNFELNRDIKSNKDLGKEYFEYFYSHQTPSFIKQYIDFEKLGNDIFLSRTGEYTEFGYIEQIYDTVEEPYNYTDFKQQGKFDLLDKQISRSQNKIITEELEL